MAAAKKLPNRRQIAHALRFGEPHFSGLVKTLTRAF